MWLKLILQCSHSRNSPSNQQKASVNTAPTPLYHQLATHKNSCNKWQWSILFTVTVTPGKKRQWSMPIGGWPRVWDRGPWAQPQLPWVMGLGAVSDCAQPPGPLPDNRQPAVRCRRRSATVPSSLPPLLPRRRRLLRATLRVWATDMWGRILWVPRVSPCVGWRRGDSFVGLGEGGAWMPPARRRCGS
jgi:hypothetical protein